MLVLSRKPDQWIVIGDNSIRIVVVDIKGDKVRLGIEAPREVPVHREEVYDAIKAGIPHKNAPERDVHDAGLLNSENVN